MSCWGHQTIMKDASTTTCKTGGWQMCWSNPRAWPISHYDIWGHTCEYLAPWSSSTDILDEARLSRCALLPEAHPSTLWSQVTSNQRCARGLCLEIFLVEMLQRSTTHYRMPRKTPAYFCTPLCPLIPFGVLCALVSPTLCWLWLYLYPIVGPSLSCICPPNPKYWQLGMLLLWTRHERLPSHIMCDIHTRLYHGCQIWWSLCCKWWRVYQAQLITKLLNL